MIGIKHESPCHVKQICCMFCPFGNYYHSIVGFSENITRSCAMGAGLKWSGRATLYNDITRRDAYFYIRGDKHPKQVKTWWY